MKQGWEIKKLGEVCETSSGGTPSKTHKEYYEGGNIPWLRSGEVSQGLIYDTELYITAEGLDNSSAKIFPIDTVVIAMYGATVGQVGVLKNAMSTNQAVCGIFPTPKFAPLFLVYYLKAKKSYFLSLAAGGAQPNISQQIIRDTYISIPPREEQEKIVEEMDCLSGVIEKKREQLRELDALAQSIFFQMFGDPITNEKGWEVNIIGNLAEFYNGVAHEGSISEDGQYDVINSKFISTQGEIRKHCDSQIFPLIKNDIVMVMSDVPNGKALAKCYLIETSDKYTLNQRICAFRNYNCFKPIFLYYYLNRHPYYLRFDDGNGQTNLRKNDVLNCPVYIPPLALQQEFADKIEAIEKQKELIKKSISEVEDLFNSRMSYYFN